MKKSKLITFMTLCTILLSNVVYANNIEVVNANDKNYILNDDLKFTKKIISYNEETKEIEIELCIENIKKKENSKEDIEIAVVLDNSTSMLQKEVNMDRKTVTYNSARQFVNLLYDNVKKLKVEVAQFSVKTEILMPFTDSKETALNGVTSYSRSACGGYTCTDTAISSISSTFSKDCKNKVIVLVTDGYPNKPEETKQQLELLNQKGIYILSLIVNKSNVDSIKEVFGTENNPTSGDVYYISSDSDINAAFNKYMYKQILKYMEHPIKDVRIEDVFPEELLKYFDIEYASSPEKGNVTNIGDNNSFTWSIDEMSGEEVLKFIYKVKIKDNVDVSNITNIKLETNEKVVINYRDDRNISKQEIFDKNPSIEVKEDVKIYSTIKSESTTVEEEKILKKKEEEQKQEENKIEVEEEIPKKENEENKQEYVVVDYTQQDRSTSRTVSNSKTVTSRSSSSERLPKTGIDDFIIVAICGSVMLSIGIGIKSRLITNKIKKIEKR